MGLNLRTVAGTVAALSLLLGVGATFNTSQAIAPHSGAIERTWARTDKPVADGQAVRSWIWGQDAFTDAIPESYEQSPGGVRMVQYYDKSRMEITDPEAVDDGVWYVSNGLLVVELTSGRVQTGHNRYEEREPAVVNVAGDPNDVTGPTYATIATVRDEAPWGAGSVITARINRAGGITDDPSLAGYNVTAAELVDIEGIVHRVAAPFWAFMNSSGVVYENGQFITDQLFENAYYATGYPITEAYWANVKVGGTPRDVLMQCFERRCLTYTPGNDPAWQVEMGNVGRHYFTWRYGDTPPATATPTATRPAPSATATASRPVPTATATATSPAPTATATPTEPTVGCHPSYPDHCIAPPPPDLNCKDIPAAWKPLRVIHNVPNPDPHRLDQDGDGWACEP
jgi:hypothetical protein